jgi:hypothetical protein
MHFVEMSAVLSQQFRGCRVRCFDRGDRRMSSAYGFIWMVIGSSGYRLELGGTGREGLQLVGDHLAGVVVCYCHGKEDQHQHQHQHHKGRRENGTEDDRDEGDYIPLLP